MNFDMFLLYLCVGKSISFKYKGDRMRRELNRQKMNCITENMITELLTVESLIKTTVNNCLNKECTAQYYAGKDLCRQLSEERNDYINLLTLALEKIKHLQMLNDEIEDLILASTM